MNAEATSDVRINLSRWATIIGFLAISTALFGSYFLLPHRMESVEKEHEKYEIKTDARLQQQDVELRQQREILIRIDENVKELRRAVDAK